MDTRTKKGKVYLQRRKPGEKWKPVWLSLVAHTSSGVGRLEIQDAGGDSAGGDHGVRRHQQSHSDRMLKVVRLSELISVLRLPPNAEACPLENMSAFCVETQDRTMVFAALKDDSVDWVEKLCHSTFQQYGPSVSSQRHMEENQIYASADKALEFWVVVQRTEAATRCGLQGSYWLKVGREALHLREIKEKNVVGEWPYELLRRYGNDKLALTIEAGRRCNSGPGSFTFETPQADKIFSLIQSTIKQKTTTVTASKQNQDGEKLTTTNIRARSPHPKIPDMTSMAAILENKLMTQERRAAASEEGTHHQENLIGSLERVSVQPAHITLMPLPLIPTLDSQPGGQLGGPSEAVYANPSDVIQSEPKPQPTMALYVDPASVLPLKPPGSKQTLTPSPTSSQSQPRFKIEQPEYLYSEVYDKINPVQIKQTFTCFTDDEPIYTEPVSKEEEVSHKKECKSDPFAHLYAQVCKTSSSSFSPSSSSNTMVSSASMTTAKTADQSQDIIYENLGII